MVEGSGEQSISSEIHTIHVWQLRVENEHYSIIQLLSNSACKV